MNDSLNKLKKKYIVTASVIVFFVIFLMVLILNLLMRVAYKNEGRMIESVIRQAAATRINQPNTEKFILSEAEQTENGDYIIPRNVRNISSITVSGNIDYAEKSAVWYSAGGGLLFEAKIEDEIKMVYKDYTFNKDTTNVSINFNNYDNIKSDYDTLSIDESQIISDYFLVSVVWWKNSSNVPIGIDENISLTIDSIEIHYKDQQATLSFSNQLVSHSSFSDIFDNYIPEILNNTSAFYLITNEKNQLVSINDGNLMKSIENAEAKEFASSVLSSDRVSGKIKKDGTVYSYTVRKMEDMNLIIFVNDSFTDAANGNLLRISLLVGGMIWLILFVLVVIVSGYIIKPVAENMERQKQFISNASHELKTPITVISATIDIISSKNGKDRWTDCIKEQTRKMHCLVSEMLDLSRLLETDTAISDFDVSNISSTVSNSLLYFESMLYESEKTLKHDIEENISIPCDENKIAQLVGILMDNALKYSDAKSEIAFSIHKEMDNVIIKCSNLCSEYLANDTSKLFERFYRRDNDRIHEQEGFGLGLSIAQAIVELHNGSISASCNDKIITFTVTLPARY